MLRQQSYTPVLSNTCSGYVLQVGGNSKPLLLWSGVFAEQGDFLQVLSTQTEQGMEELVVALST